MAANPTVEKFSRIIEKVFGRKITEKQIGYDSNSYGKLFKYDYDTALGIVISTKQAAVLTQLMNAYLNLYGRYSANKDNIHFYMSDQTFLLLFEQSTKVDKEKGDLFEIWDGFLTGNKISDNSNSFKKRYAELKLTAHSQIEAFRNEQREKKRQSKSILDVLRDEYSKQHGYAIKNNDDLYDFDPKASATVKTKLEEQLKRLQPHWNKAKKEYTKDDAVILNMYLMRFRFFIKQESIKNVLVLFQLIKYLQDIFRIEVQKVENKNTGRTETYYRPRDPHETVLFYALYTIACIELMVIAQAGKLYQRNRYGFTPEEVSYFLKPVRVTYTYYSNIEKIIKDIPKSIDTLVEEVKSFLSFYMLTQNQLKGIELVSLGENIRIQNIWNDISIITHKIKSVIESNQANQLIALINDPNNKKTLQQLREINETEYNANTNAQDVGKGKAKAGVNIGTHEKYGGITIVYIEPKNINQIYIEFESLKPQLFIIHKDFIDHKFYGNAILEMYKSTIGMVYVTQAIFLAMGFLPTFIEAGFAGVIYEIAVFYGSQKLEEKIAAYNPTLGKLVGFLFQLVVPRPHFGPKVVDNVSTFIEKADNTGLSVVLNFEGKDKMILNKSITNKIAPESNKLRILQLPEHVSEQDFTKLIHQQNEINAANLELRGTLRKAIDKVKDITGKTPALTSENAGIRAEEKAIAKKLSAEDAVLGRTQKKLPANDVNIFAANDNVYVEPLAQTAEGSVPVMINKSKSEHLSSDPRISMSRKTSPNSPVTKIRGITSSQRGTQGHLTGMASTSVNASRERIKALYVMDRADVLPGGKRVPGRGIFTATRYNKSYSITGDMLQFRESQVGHHVYEYYDRKGKLLYTGKSGGGLGPKNPISAANNWIDRLNKDHINTDWIFGAHKVRVTYDIPEQGMWALEETLIPISEANKALGDFSKKFEGGDLGANAISTLGGKRAEFIIDVGAPK